MLMVMAAIWLGLDALTAGTFLTPRNLFNLSLQVAVVGIMSCGMVLVIVSRQIDLSVGSQIGFIGVFGALLQNSILPIDASSTWWIAVLAMLAALVQGLLIAYGGVPSFVITLGGLLFFRNAAFYINSGVTIAPLNKTFSTPGRRPGRDNRRALELGGLRSGDRRGRRLGLARSSSPGRARNG
jgi:D-xylose transport system permease protein